MAKPQLDTRFSAATAHLALVRFLTLKRRIKQEALDLLELVLLPGLAAALPWPVCYALFKRIARCRWLYQEQCNAALDKARQMGWAGTNEAHWLWVRRLITLVDHADHYLGIARTDRWMDKYLQVNGQWPEPSKPMMLVTFHWGAGYWGLRHAAAHGLHPHALVASLESPAYAGRSILTWYATARNKNVAKTLAANTIDITRNLKQVIRVLRSNRPLLGVLDVPADQAQAGLEVELIQRRARVARGLLRLAVDEKVRITYYITGIHTDTGIRFLKIKEMPIALTVEQLASDMFQELDALIHQEAPAWHFWSISDRFFQRSP